MRRLVAILAVAILAACGVPQELPKQAERVESIAAEGALLAQDASEGETPATFRRAHGKALRDQLGALRPSIRDEGLARTADAVGRQLDRLVADGSSAAVAADVQRRLERAAEQAGELAA